MWVLWLCKDAYTAALCKEAPVSDSLILQSVLEPEGFSHAELGDKEPQQHSKRGNKSQSDTHSLITSPKLHSTAKNTCQEPTTTHQRTHTHLQNNEEKPTNHTCVRQQHRLWVEVNEHNDGHSHSESDVRDRVGNGIQDTFDGTHLCLPLSSEQWKGLASSSTVAAHRDNEAGRGREREREREGGREGDERVRSGWRRVKEQEEGAREVLKKMANQCRNQPENLMKRLCISDQRLSATERRKGGTKVPHWMTLRRKRGAEAKKRLGEKVIYSTKKRFPVLSKFL